MNRQSVAGSHKS